jgi:hypothetical protein
MTMIDTSDSRFAKAVAIADQAAGWAKCRAADGRKAYGVPSSKGNGRFYLVTQTSCDCFDSTRHVCKHSIAVQIHCARVVGQPMPASDVVDGLAQMVVDRRSVLDMIREPDGSIRWERSHQHPALDPETVRLAEQYERIFGRL